MKSSATTSPLDDIEYLARSDHRVTALSTLARRPQSRADLLAITGVSQSTIGRTLREFEDRAWIHRDGKHYEATQLGAFVADGMRALVERIETEQALRDVWQWLPPETSGFTVEMVAEAVVTVAEFDDPYRPVNRFRSLFEGTDRFRFAGFHLALLEPCMDELCGRIVDGMQTEIIDPPHVVDCIRSTYPEQSTRALESGNLSIRVHDDLPPYGVGMFDDRAVVCGYDTDNGLVRVVVDTATPETSEWVESTYRTYRRENPTLALDTSTGSGQAP